MKKIFSCIIVLVIASISFVYAQYQGVLEGSMHVEKIYFHFLSDNKIDFHLVGEKNGEVMEKITGTFVKK
jgi:hypothetical protein